MSTIRGQIEASVERHRLDVRWRGYLAKKACWRSQKEMQPDLEFSLGKNKVPIMEIERGREGKSKTKHVDQNGAEEAMALAPQAH